MRRPLCLFVLSFACISFLLQMVSQRTFSRQFREKPFVQQIYKIQEGCPVYIIGQLEKKEEKNGNQIYYLKHVQILEPADKPENQLENQSKSQFQSQDQMQSQSQSGTQSESAEMGAVCYVENTGKEAISVYSRNTQNMETPLVGQWLLIRGTMSFYDQAENEGQFDSRAYYEGMGYHFKLYDARVEKGGESYDKLGEWLFEKKQELRTFFEANMKEDNAGILTAMLLGDKTAMNGEIKTLYQKSGIAHVLAISGLHISLLGMCFYRFLRRCYLPLPVCCFIGIGVILLYGKMTGPGTSSFRAICMFILFLLADLLNRTYDLPSAMAFVAFLSFLENPEILTEAGFLLSYLAVIGLAVINPVLKVSFEDCIVKLKKVKWSENKIVRNPIIKKLTDSLLASISTQIMIFPVLLWFYYEFSLYSIFLNLIVIPCMSTILLSGVTGCVTGFSFCLIPADLLLDFYEWLCTQSRRLPDSLVITGRPEQWQVALYYGLILGWLYFAGKGRERRKKGKNRKKKERAGKEWLCFVMPIFCMLLFLIPVHRENRIDILSVGQGDCICLRDKRGNAVLVDGGSSDVKEAGKYRLIPFLKYNGISYIDVVFVSHAHEDHYSAILELLETGKEEGIKVGAVCVSTVGKNKEEYEVIFTAAEKAGAEIIYIQKGDELTCGEMQFTCLYPGGNVTVTDENDASLILYGVYKKETTDFPAFSMLFTGDSTINCDSKVVEELKKRNISTISLLKVAHHGSGSSTGEELLEQLNPLVSVISCGEDNSYGHPHAETIERLADVGSEVFYTKQNGQVILNICKDKFEIVPYIRKDG